ncbi:hypothetical protein [Ramlibacter sp.]|uniref:hypothetical protein n=1 Tax=Ramlibacter sp. TaxID=1917967 RepID=UPI002D0DB2E3|nr:hypothetical protein [Ramlibacter sp.]HWI82464.1 hypothetical protein [Ramlibacter sp.]
MNRAWSCLLAALAPLLAGAADADPMLTPKCLAARGELEALLVQLGPKPDPRLEQARRRAADLCLGRASGRPQRAGAPEPALVVPPTAAAAMRETPPPAVAAPPPVIPRPTVVTTCDPGGCWDSQGRRLNQMGPLLVGPGGVCSVQGGLVNCP